MTITVYIVHNFGFIRTQHFGNWTFPSSRVMGGGEVPRSLGPYNKLFSGTAPKSGSQGPNWVGTFPLSPLSIAEDRAKSSFRSFMFG
jgi:hypothetical protein